MKHLHFVFPDGMLKTMLPVGSALFAPSFRKQLTAVFGYDTGTPNKTDAGRASVLLFSDGIRTGR